MKKIVKAVLFSACLLAMIIFSFNACGKPHQHVYLNKILINEPTHTEKGAYRCMCPCGHIYIEEIATIGMHTYYVESTKEPTHTEYGVRTYTCRCGESYTEKIEKVRHTYVSQVTTNPTHTKLGVRTYTCECGHSYTESITKTPQHTYASAVTTEPTCTANGVLTYSCECGKSYTEDIEKEKHSYVNEVCKCGKTQYIKMWDISKSTEDNVIAKLYNSPEKNGLYLLKISGTGNMESWFSGTPWGADKRNITSVEIGESVTNIGASAFEDFTALKSITISEGIKTINVNAFNGCNLSEIKFNAINMDNLAYDNYAFYNAGGSEGVKVIFGDKVTRIPNNLFHTETGSLLKIKITEITIGKNVKEIGVAAFYNCTALEKVTMGESVESIGKTAFYNCKGLKSITIPESVKSIGVNAFYDCINLTEINFNAIDMNDVNHEYIFSHAGQNGTGINVIIGDNVREIPNNLFRCAYMGYEPKIVSVTIGKNVTKIGESAFRSCAELTTVTIPDNVKIIGDEAFAFCSGITKLTIGKGVTHIGLFAFSRCTSITSVVFVNTQGWYYTESSTATSGTNINVENDELNAKNFQSLYVNSYLKRK